MLALGILLFFNLCKGRGRSIMNDGAGLRTLGGFVLLFFIDIHFEWGFSLHQAIDDLPALLLRVSQTVIFR